MGSPLFIVTPAGRAGLRNELPAQAISPIVPAMTNQSIAQFPAVRLRRLRQSAGLRRLIAETRVSPDQLVLPLFVRSGQKVRQSVPSMPGVFQLSVDEMVKEADGSFGAGVRAVLLFGIPDAKDDKASGAYSAGNAEGPKNQLSMAKRGFGIDGSEPV